MFDRKRVRFSWLFVVLALAGSSALFVMDLPVAVSSDHDRVQDHVERGDIMSLSSLLGRAELRGYRVLEAELEEEHGQLVYELELLDAQGSVSKRYFDASSGEPISGVEHD